MTTYIYIVYSFFLLLIFICNESFARSVPRRQRNFGNFGPDINRSFVTFLTQDVPVIITVDAIEVDIIESTLLSFSLNSQVPIESIRVSSFHQSSHNGVTHVYVQQVLNGLDVVNGVGNINIDKNGKIISIGNSFYAGEVPTEESLSQLRDHSTAAEALVSLAQILQTEFFPLKVPPTLKYIQNGSNHIRLVWDIRADTEHNAYNAFMDAETHQLIQLVDWISDASYNVYPIGINDPSSGERSIVVNPSHPIASPYGWHLVGSNNSSTETKGNNVYAQENFAGSHYTLENDRPDGTTDLNFDFPIDLTQDPKTYINASVTNLFYWNNIVHDLYYQYGFTEEAGNFQKDNFDRGGKGGDPVIANAQQGRGMNNAYFFTPPDGGSGEMMMFVWFQTDPNRDGSLDGGIIVHEYTHGLSNRLTGGPKNVNCLSDGEARGMGEGWGDIIATILRTTENTTRDQNYAIGDYLNGGTGLRRYLYSTNMITNPSTYSYTRRPDYSGEHAKGEVWAVILYEVYWNMVDKHGFDRDWFNVNQAKTKESESYIPLFEQTYTRQDKPNPTVGGNVIFLQLLLDGMKLQPCHPNFVDARNAIVQADMVNNGGENTCELYKGFAKRGLGVSASSPGVDGFDIPSECS